MFDAIFAAKIIIIIIIIYAHTKKKGEGEIQLNSNVKIMFSSKLCTVWRQTIKILCTK